MLTIVTILISAAVMGSDSEDQEQDQEVLCPRPGFGAGGARRARAPHHHLVAIGCLKFRGSAKRSLKVLHEITLSPLQHFVSLGFKTFLNTSDSSGLLWI